MSGKRVLKSEYKARALKFFCQIEVSGQSVIVWTADARRGLRGQVLPFALRMEKAKGKT